jgi:L-2-hydroxyglutarate oxidase LhgO
MFDVLIIGGGVSGISCSVLGSAKANRSPLVKKLNLHASKASSLQEAVLIMPMVLLLNFRCHIIN